MARELKRNNEIWRGELSQRRGRDSLRFMLVWVVRSGDVTTSAQQNGGGFSAKRDSRQTCTTSGRRADDISRRMGRGRNMLRVNSLDGTTSRVAEE